MILNATSKYSVIFLYLFWITTIFQANILFKTNKCHHGGPLGAEGPGQLPRSPLPNPALQPHTIFFSTAIRRDFRPTWYICNYELPCCNVSRVLIHCFNAQPYIFAVAKCADVALSVLLPCFDALLDIFAVMNWSLLRALFYVQYSDTLCNNEWGERV